MRIHLVRHGRTEANRGGLLLGRADPELDAVGRAQAEAVARSLGPVSRIITSPLRRTRSTADAIASLNPNAVLEVEPAFVEIDYGDWDERPLADIGDAVWAEWRSDPDFAPPGGESLRELGSRVGDAMTLVSATLDQGSTDPHEAAGDLVIVTHVSPIKAAVAWALGVDHSIAWRLFVAPASVSTLRLTSGIPAVVGFNWTAHLGPEIDAAPR